MTRRLVSVGYEGRSIDELVEALLAEGVSTLVDVRLTPLSRKTGMSKTRLAQTLAAHGITYVHLPALGNPKDNRAPFRGGEPISRERFTERLNTAAGLQTLTVVSELLDSQTVALLCFERRHEQCHRHLVADQLRRHDATIRLTTL